MPHVSLQHSYGVFQCLCYAAGDSELRRQVAHVSGFDDTVAGFHWLQLLFPVGSAVVINGWTWGSWRQMPFWRKSPSVRPCRNWRSGRNFL
ncbi:hypothetical protein CEXT_148781 [Caerostris extrusa]|uniref:Uncharacterized protein n=1 Tax=Caerostris extrusa TaxID=172846 RepID=A0AAV4RTJ9_CAEEX|nr:hypothetical protein CEXT_148781 [Caerostris extrusa]